MHEIPSEILIKCNFIYEEFDKGLVREILDSLKMDNLQTIIVSKKYD